MPRILALLGFAVTAAALWWFHSVSADYMLFAALTFTRCLDVAASMATALLAVLVIEHGVVRLMLVTAGGGAIRTASTAPPSTPCLAWSPWRRCWRTLASI